MFRVSEKLAILFSLCTFLQFGTSSGGKWTIMTQSLSVQPENIRLVRLGYDKDSFSTHGYVYGVCVFEKSSTDSSCTIYMETNEGIGSSKHLRSCKLTMPIPETIEITRMIYLDNDKAAIFTQNHLLSFDKDSDSILTILRFTDCSTQIIDISYDIGYSRITSPSNGTFDLIGMSACENGIFCRMTIDFEDGKIVTNPYQWIKRYTEMHAAIRSPTKEIIVAHTYKGPDDTHRFLRVSAIDDDGKTRFLKQYPVNSRWWYEDGIAHSTSHRLFSVCAAANQTATCAQFDNDGTLKFEVTIAVVEPVCLHKMKMFNLPDGGFLFLYAYCSKTTSDVFVTKVNFLGQRFETLKLTRFTGRNILDKMHFFFNEKMEYCISQPFYRPAEVTLEIACFGQNEIPIQLLEVGVNE